MVVQVKHEAEVSRQHARYRIPAKIEIEGHEYELSEWSVSGFSANGVGGDLSTWSTHRHGTMIFDLESFRLSLKLEFEILQHDPQAGLLRVRFVNVARGNLSLLHYVINAYLSGEVVTAGDILTIAGRDGFIKKNLDERLEAPLSGLARLRRRTGRAIGHLALVGAFSLLLGFIASNFTADCSWLRSYRRASRAPWWCCGRRTTAFLRPPRASLGSPKAAIFWGCSSSSVAAWPASKVRATARCWRCSASTAPLSAVANRC